MRKLAILFTFGIFGLISCENTWDKHFENDEQGEGNRLYCKARCCHR